MQDANGRPDGTETDDVLVSRFRDGGDPSAFEALVRRHRRDVYRLAWRLLGNHTDADDVTQEAFVRAWRGLRGFRGEAGFKTWLTRIVVNLAWNARQRRRATPPEDPGAVERAADAIGAPGHASPPGGQGPQAVLRAQVRRLVDSLPRRQRQVLHMKVYAGMTFREIARAAGISVGAAKATFFQAVSGLRERLAAPRTAPAVPGARLWERGVGR